MPADCAFWAASCLGNFTYHVMEAEQTELRNTLQQVHTGLKAMIGQLRWPEVAAHFRTAATLVKQARFARTNLWPQKIRDDLVYTLNKSAYHAVQGSKALRPPTSFGMNARRNQRTRREILEYQAADAPLTEEQSLRKAMALDAAQWDSSDDDIKDEYSPPYW